MSVNSSAPFSFRCLKYKAAFFISLAFNATKVLLLLPLYVLILYLGYQQWRRRSSSAATRHSDVFTFQAAALELMYASGIAVTIGGSLTGYDEMTIVGTCVSSITIPGQIVFHILTCVERYLAVVHPVVYLGLRQSGGVKVRNVGIACVWLLCFGWSGFTVMYLPDTPNVPYFCLLVFSLIIITFCSLCVLRVLIRPGPGEVGGDRERVDRSKQRASNTINAIMAVLWLWFAGLLLGLALGESELLSERVGCLVLTSAFWFSLPSHLVLPMLFLHRAGKLPRGGTCCPSNG